MSLKTPEELSELAQKLSTDWQDGNVSSVGTGYGKVIDGEPWSWNLYVWANDPDAASEKYPHNVGGYNVLFREIARAL